ncbi:efflux RND transporter periplasmic adaptor subunit [Saccharospirillum salsuginis]|uniref:RND transporter n=1 Tax=Saccharospirillum salsuginis TaxID=418750 RepID=A0A918K7J8_9GAMM|nr:efflux RND transporter periplasmic adaptor subunit [Saccharospirillum salsuginis]GGX49859.1 RND transporter [Saccharospirillum salsuginis]
MKKALILIVILALAVGTPLVANWTGRDTGTPVETVSLERQTIETLTLASGSIIFGDERKLRPEVTALVSDVLVEEGDAVERNEVVIQLDQDQFQSDVENQQAAVRLREIDIERGQVQIAALENQLDRQQLLFERNVANADSVQALQDQLALARVDLRATQQQLAVAQLALEQAQERLEKTLVRAPIDGTVSALDIKEGEMAISGNTGDQALMTVADTSRTYAEIEIDEADIGRVSRGQTVKVFAVAYPDTPLEGRVETIALTARQAQGRSGLSFTVKVLITDTRDLEIRPGMSCRAEIITTSAGEQWALPLEAVQQDIDAGTAYVWVLENGQAQRREVTLGPSDDRYQAIESGLEPETKVIAGPVRTLIDLTEGQAVTAKVPADSDEAS